MCDIICLFGYVGDGVESCVIFDGGSLDELYSLFSPLFNGPIQLFGISTKPCVRVYKPVSVAKNVFIELAITVFLSLPDCPIKYAYFISVQNFYAAFFKMLR